MRISSWMAVGALAALAACSSSSNSNLSQTLTVSKTGTGGGTVTSSPAGISCGGTCSASFGQGTTVTLTAAADAGSTFTGWSGACTGSAATCTVTMSAGKTVTATFDAIPQTLNVQIAGAGNGEVVSTPQGIDCTSLGGGTCAANFNQGTSVTLQANVDANTVFVGWTGDCQGQASTCTVTLDAAKSVTATFDIAAQTLTVQLTGTGAGQVDSDLSPAWSCASASCQVGVSNGGVVTLTANAAAHSVFTGWGGACAGESSNVCTVTMDQAQSVTAGFDWILRTVTVTQSGYGTGSVDSVPSGALSCSGSTCTGIFPEGQDVVLQASASAGNSAHWFAGCDLVSSDGLTCTLSALPGDASVDVKYDIEVSGLTATTDGLQDVTVSWDLTSAPVDHVQLQYRPMNSSLPIQTVQVPSGSSSVSLSGILPGATYAYSAETVYSDSSISRGVTTTHATAFTGNQNTSDFSVDQTVTGSSGNEFYLTWSDTNLFIGASGNGGGPLLLNPGDSLWIAIDSDAATDSTGASRTVDTEGGSFAFDVIWPFNADYVVQLTRGAGGPGDVTARVLNNVTGSSFQMAPASSLESDFIDEVMVDRSSIGDPSNMRIAFVAVSNGATPGSFTFAPFNPAATDVWGVHTSLTSSLDPGANVFQANKAATSLSASPQVDAAALVSFSVTLPAPASAPVMMNGNLSPLDYTLGNSNYALVDDLTGTNTYVGTFNFGGTTDPLYFEFVQFDGVATTVEPGFGNGKDRVRSLSGLNEALPPLGWGTEYDLTHPFTITFEFNDATPAQAFEIRGSTAELGTWAPAAGPRATLLQNGDYAATVGFSPQDVMTDTIQWKIGYLLDDGAGNVSNDTSLGSGGWENGSNHGTDNDIIDAVTFTWSAGDGSFY